jgi:Cell division protein anillin
MFDKGGIPRSLSAFNIFPCKTPSSAIRKQEISTSDNQSTDLTSTTQNISTSTPSSSRINSSFLKPSRIFNRYNAQKLPVKSNQVFHEEKKDTNFQQFQDVFKDLDNFIEKELNDIQVCKRIGQKAKDKLIKERDSETDDKIYSSLQKLRDEVYKIKLHQKEVDNKLKSHESLQMISSNKREEKAVKKGVKEVFIQTTPQDSSNESTLTPIKECHISKCNSDSTITANVGFLREQKIRRLEEEIYKEETLMMKINRVLENVKKIDENNVEEVVNIERHYLVASTRFQAALTELRKLNEETGTLHPAPYNRKGKLVVRDIMLEVKPSYFLRRNSGKNEFLLGMMKYEDKIFATKPFRIANDVRVIKFADRFSIPETYMDFEMRLEIFGTTFWRKNTNVRETMFKKYGFVTFNLTDTGKKPKRFTMIEVVPSDNLPIRSKVLMSITQKITTDIQYKGKLFVKIRKVWHTTTAYLKGHLIEIVFHSLKKGVTQTSETMVLDLYNFDSEAVIPMDARVSDKNHTFLLKFNHYVDVGEY